MALHLINRLPWYTTSLCVLGSLWWVYRSDASTLSGTSATEDALRGNNLAAVPVAAVFDLGLVTLDLFIRTPLYATAAATGLFVGLLGGHAGRYALRRTNFYLQLSQARRRDSRS